MTLPKAESGSCIAPNAMVLYIFEVAGMGAVATTLFTSLRPLRFVSCLSCSKNHFQKF